MNTYFFSGDYDELSKLALDLEKNNHTIHKLSNDGAEYNWLETVSPIIFALLSSTVLATAIKEYIKYKSLNITIEIDEDDKKYKIKCPKGSYKVVKQMLTDLNLIKNNSDDNAIN